MTTPFRLATALRTTLAAALVALALPVFADVRGGCDKKDCERKPDDLGRSIAAKPAAPKPLPIVKQPWAIAQSASEMTIVVDPYGNVFSGASRAGADSPVWRGNLQHLGAPTGKPLPKLQARRYSVALAGTNGEFAVIADNHGNVYSGAIRPPVDIAPLAQAVRLQGGRNCTKVDCE